MVKRSKYIIAYDITSNKRRRKIVEILENFGGLRKNKSVFELYLKMEEKSQLQSELRSKIKKQDDTLLLYPICKSCYAKAVFLGNFAEIPTTLEA